MMEQLNDFLASDTETRIIALRELRKLKPILSEFDINDIPEGELHYYVVPKKQFEKIIDGILDDSFNDQEWLIEKNKWLISRIESRYRNYLLKQKLDAQKYNKKMVSVYRKNNIIFCEKCYSTNVSVSSNTLTKNISNGSGAFLFGLTGVYMGESHTETTETFKCTCNNCGNRWTKKIRY